METTTLVSEIMTSEVQTVGINDRLSDVRRLLSEGNFHHVPVVDGETLVGIISSRDLIRIHHKFPATSSENKSSLLDSTSSIAETMQTELVTIQPDENIDRAIDLLARGNIHSVLVVDEDDGLVGIVTNVDLLEYLFQ